jgi:hypothetical protein
MSSFVSAIGLAALTKGPPKVERFPEDTHRLRFSPLELRHARRQPRVEHDPHILLTAIRGSHRRKRDRPALRMGTYANSSSAISGRFASVNRPSAKNTFIN